MADHLDKEYAIGVAISKSTGANMVDVTDRVMAEVEEISKLPQMQGINIFDLDNMGDSVRKSLGDLLSAGAIGALLALVVLYLFLRQMTTTIVVTASVPFSLLITLGRTIFRRTESQHVNHDGPDACDRHAGGQCRCRHRERFSSART